LPSSLRGAVQWARVMMPSWGYVGSFRNIGLPAIEASNMPEGITTKSDSQKARYPSSLSVLSARQADVSASGMIVPMQLLIVIDRQFALAISLRKIWSKSMAFSTNVSFVSSVVLGSFT
jgi:hypothetical protein